MVNITKTLLAKLKNNTILTLDGMETPDIVKLVQKANLAYRNGKELLLSDDLYDSVVEYLEQRDPENPVLKTIGAAVTSGKKVALPYFMGSLDKIKTDDKLIAKFKEQYPCSYMVSEKLDGNSALLTSDGKTVKLYTRGDGHEGQDISHLVQIVRHIPRGLNEHIAVRGELIISRNDFEKVKHKGANARNMVAGLLNAKTPDLELAKLIQFIAYELINPVIVPESQFARMRDMGFKVVKGQLLSDNTLTTDQLSDILVKARKESEFEVDGIVIMHNAMHPRKTAENPKYAFAFKSVATMEKAEVVVTKIEWNMSKDGYLVPVVNFHPVHLAGVVIQKAHGFNGKFIQDNKLGPGSRITIMRSGDVIPYILDVLSPSDSGKPAMPSDEYIWTESGVDIVIKNKDDNEELALKNLQYFFDKIDIKGVSGATIKKIYDAGIKDIKSIINVTKDKLMLIDGFKQKSADNFVSAMKDAFMNVDCVKLMDASNVLGRGIGAKKLQLVVDAFPGIITKNYTPSVTELTNVKGVEKKTAELIASNLPKYFGFVAQTGIRCNSKNKEIIENSKLKDKVIVFSGFRDKELEEKVIAAGGRIATTVSSKTDVVVVKTNDGSSSKILKAKELGISVQHVTDFTKTFF